MIFTRLIIGIQGLWNDSQSRNETPTKEEEDGSAAVYGWRRRYSMRCACSVSGRMLLGL